MRTETHRADLAAAMEAGFKEDFNTGRHCQGLADAYMASLPTDTEGRDDYDRWVRRSLEINFEVGDVVATFHYLRVKAVRVAMRIAQERGEVSAQWDR